MPDPYHHAISVADTKLVLKQMSIYFINLFDSRLHKIWYHNLSKSPLLKSLKFKVALSSPVQSFVMRNCTLSTNENRCHRTDLLVISIQSKLKGRFGSSCHSIAMVTYFMKNVIISSKPMIEYSGMQLLCHQQPETDSTNL